MTYFKVTSHLKINTENCVVRLYSFDLNFHVAVVCIIVIIMYICHPLIDPLNAHTVMYVQLSVCEAGTHSKA